MDFDTLIPRQGTWSLKWDNPKNRPGQPDIIPLWVADMDFAAPEPVLAALRSRLDHPVIGYTNLPPDYFSILARWYAERYRLALDPSVFLLGPAVMPAMAAILRALTEPGESVAIMTPVYRPFFDTVTENGRVLHQLPLRADAAGRQAMDLAALAGLERAEAAAGRRLSAVLLSNPHNPGGRVWPRAELAALDAWAAERGVAVISDEIHADLVFDRAAFTGLADPAFVNPRRLVLAGPNKTFNIAGLHICHAIVPDAATRRTAAKALAAAGFSQPNALAAVAARAAYATCGDWVDGLLAYVRGNFAWLAEFFAARLPEVRFTPPESTYLAWVDCRELAKACGCADDAELVRRLEDEARVKLSPGSLFGQPGAGWVRINVACPRALLAEGLERVATWRDARVGGR